MKKIALLSIVAGTLVFGQEVVIQKNIELKSVNPEEIKENIVVDFCIKGLLYRGFESANGYLTSKIVLEPASFHQVIGSDGKPMTCRVEEK